MVFVVYFASGSSLFTFVAIPTPPTTSSRADAMKNRVRRVLRTVLAARESLSFRNAAKFAELLGEVVTDSTKKNLEMRVDAEFGATDGKTDLAKRAKALNLDAIHDTVHEMARDEARHGKALKGLLERYFG